MRSRVALASAVALLSTTTLAACSSAQGRNRSAATGRPVASVTANATTQPCGPATAEALARTVGLVGERIYRNELGSSEVNHDKRQVETYAPLLSALERNDRKAIGEAVTSLVYSHTHVVRLRVTRGSTVLSDVGGPYILAPVGGALRRGGRTLGHYVLSVQDDLGYVKLVSRFLGVPLALGVGSHALTLEGALGTPPAAIPAHGPVTYRGVAYQAFSFDAHAFPSGTLRISLLAPVARSLSALTCSQVKVAELGEVARRLSLRFSLSPASYSSFIKATTPLTHGLIYVRAGSRQLAASTQPGPSRLPTAGAVRYRGTTYYVTSFASATSSGPARVYQLVRP